MPTFKFGDDVYKIESLPTREACEAEKALGLSTLDGGMSLLAVQLFVAMRQSEPGLPAGIIADRVNATDWLKVDVADEEDETPLEAKVGSEPAVREEATDLLTSGRPR